MFYVYPAGALPASAQSRYTGTFTFTVKGYGHGVDIGFLRELLNFATGGLWPDRTFLFDVDSETGLMRRRKGGVDWNRMDDYELAYHRRVRSGYLELAAAEPGRWQVIDAGRSQDEVYDELLASVLQLIA